LVYHIRRGASLRGGGIHHKGNYIFLDFGTLFLLQYRHGIKQIGMKFWFNYQGLEVRCIVVIALHWMPWSQNRHLAMINNCTFLTFS